MNFSKEWEDQYKANRHMSIWPWSDLISSVHSYASPNKGYNKVLELGCGAGANIPFFLSLDVDYYAIDGSQTIITKLQEKFPLIASKLVVDDFTSNIPFSNCFDLIVDRSSLISNSNEAMLNGLKLVNKHLRNNGRFIGIDWFSNQHEGAKLGDALDSHTRNNFPQTSDLANIGQIHFCDKAHLINMLEGTGFQIIHLEHKTVERHFPKRDKSRSWWNFVVEKK